MRFRKIVSISLAALLTMGTPLSAMADLWDIGLGSVTIEAKEDGQWVSQNDTTTMDEAPTVTGTTIDNTLTIIADANQTADVTISDLEIAVAEGGNSGAITAEGEGNVAITIEGENHVSGSESHAGLEKSNDGNLTINGGKDDSLTAIGGAGGAGIGGAVSEAVSDITINGGTIYAEATNYAPGSGAGIGGGGAQLVADSEHNVEFITGGDASNITINGGNVTAVGGIYGSGIGSGSGDATDITINGGIVNATGKAGGAGIGGGDASNITINGGEVTAIGTGDSSTKNNGGAGIGGSVGGSGENITINGGKVNASAEEGAAAIGGGRAGDGKDITITGGEVYAEVTPSGNFGSGASIGAGTGIMVYGGNAENITISGGSVTAVVNGNGTAIGGGANPGNSDNCGKASNIVVSGNAKVTVDTIGGVGIGTGGTGGAWNADHKREMIPGEEITPDTSKLTPDGSITYIDRSVDPEDPVKTIVGNYVPPVEPTEPSEPDEPVTPPQPVTPVVPMEAKRTDVYVTSEDGTALSSEVDIHEGTLTVTLDIPADDSENVAAKCLVSRESLEQLVEQGILEFRIVTPKGMFKLNIADLLAKLGDSFCFVINGDHIMLVADETIDLSELIFQ